MMYPATDSSRPQAPDQPNFHRVLANFWQQPSVTATEPNHVKYLHDNLSISETDDIFISGFGWKYIKQSEKKSFCFRLHYRICLVIVIVKEEITQLSLSSLFCWNTINKTKCQFINRLFFFTFINKWIFTTVRVSWTVSLKHRSRYSDVEGL